jgi:uncharacterized protein (DUF1501 family)
MISRRNLLIRSASAGVGSGILSLGVPAPGLWRQAAAAAEPRADLPILVVVELTGGNDGLNTVIPYADDVYHKNRPTLRIEPDKVLKLDDHVGLHPSLKELHAVWELGDLAVLQGVGYPNPNRSHTRSMEIWQTGVVGAAPPTGWLGRVADSNSSLKLCHVGPESVPMAVRGRTSIPQALASLTDFQLVERAGLFPALQTDQADKPLVGVIRQRFGSARDLAARLAAIPPGPVSSAAASVPETLEGRLATIHRLIAADMPLRVYYTSQGGFDTHASQRFVHQNLLRQVSQAVVGFLKSLKPSRLDERVVVLVFSEFGRRLKENTSGGTDHGAAAPVLLAGVPVKASLIGPAPNLAALDDGGDPYFTTDFRDVYGTLLRRWLAVDPEPILGRRDCSLPLF